MLIFTIIAKLKNFAQRAMSYLTYINSLLIIMTFLSVRNYQIPLYIVLPTLILSVSIIGWLDYKYIFAEEIKHINTRNDIKKDLEKIKKKLDIKWTKK